MRWNPNRKTTRIKKDAHKKIFIVLLSFTLAFTAFIQSEQKASANPLLLAVPAGMTAGAGAYLAGGLMLSGLVGVAGFHEYQTSINEHSWGVWQNSTDLAKDSINGMIQAASGSGVALQQIDQGVNDWVESSIGKMAQLSYQTVYPQTITENGMTLTPFRWASTTGILFANSQNLDTGKSFLVNGVKTNAYQILANPNGKIEIVVYKLLAAGGEEKITFSIADGTYGMTLNELTQIMQQAQTVSESMAILTTIGASVTIIDNATYQDYIGIERNIQETWETMRDAGLVLPVDGVTTHVGDIPVRVNESGDAYTDDAGTVYNPADVDYAFPVPRIRTEDVPVPGVYTDTPALTGNPAIDQTIVGNPAIPHTTTNITTGQTVANPDIPTGGGTPTNPPPETPAPLPRVPGSQGPVPIMMFLAFFDLLRALIMYLVRMFNWIMTIPFVPEKPIDNPYFQWFRQAKILGVYPYTLVTSMAAFFLSFKLVTAVRRFLP